MIIRYSEAESAILYAFMGCKAGTTMKWETIRNMQSVGVILTPRDMQLAAEGLIRQKILRCSPDMVKLTERGANLIRGLRYEDWQPPFYKTYIYRLLSL